jgi:hypothetical protein
MMAQPSRRAVEATRDTDGIVHIESDGGMKVTFEGYIPLECESLIKDGFLISPRSGRQKKVTLYK